MAEFVIKTADERGYVRELVESGRTESEIRDRFTQQGLLVVSVKPRGILVGGKVQGRRRKVKLAQFVIFNQQLVTLLRAGLPILQALDILIKQQKDQNFRSLLENVRARVKAGELLSEAFEAQGVFPKIYSTTMLAGEKSGNMEEVLTRYVHFQRLALSFRKKLTASLIYPAILSVGIFAMLSFLMTFVVPRFAELYFQLGAELPAMTVIMLKLGLNLQHYALFILAALVLLGVGLWRWARTNSGSRRIDQIRLAMPILGGIWLKYQVAIFTRMMATLLAGGLPLVPAMETAGASIQSRSIASAIETAAQGVREGRTLSRSLQDSEQFPELSIEMIEVGESTGALPQMLTSVAEFYEEDVETALAAALSLIEPIILIIMAVVVGFVMISLYLPIFKLGAAGTMH